MYNNCRVNLPTSNKTVVIMLTFDNRTIDDIDVIVEFVHLDTRRQCKYFTRWIQKSKSHPLWSSTGARVRGTVGLPVLFQFYTGQVNTVWVWSSTCRRTRWLRQMACDTATNFGIRHRQRQPSGSAARAGYKVGSRSIVGVDGMD